MLSFEDVRGGSPPPPPPPPPAPALGLFVLYVNVSEMRPWSSLSSQPLTIPATLVILRDGWSIPVLSTLGDYLPFLCGE